MTTPARMTVTIGELLPPAQAAQLRALGDDLARAAKPAPARAAVLIPLAAFAGAATLGVLGGRTAYHGQESTVATVGGVGAAITTPLAYLASRSMGPGAAVPAAFAGFMAGLGAGALQVGVDRHGWSGLPALDF